MKILELSGIRKSFGNVDAVDGVDLAVEEGELLAILGPSGCGKSTLLSMIAGIACPDEGRLVLDGKVLSGPNGEFASPEKRNIGFVFQNYALWPHMTVEKNISYPLRIRREKKQVIEEETERILKLIRLEQKRSCHPGNLSGGEQQRVALGRALIMKPRLLLLDEPLSNLDAKLRESMQEEIRSIQKTLGITALHVTHDQAEALAISDRIAVMNKGRIVQMGTPPEIYNEPENAFTADFVGTNNVIGGRSIRRGGRLCFDAGSGFVLDLPGGENFKPRLYCIIRPENVTLAKDGGLPAIVLSRVYKGAHNLYTIDAGGRVLKVQTHCDVGFNPGDVVSYSITGCRFVEG